MKEKFKRIGAYLFDTLLILVVCLLLSNINLINPKKDKVKDMYEEVNIITLQITNFPKELEKKLKDGIISKKEYNSIKADYKNYKSTLHIIKIDEEINVKAQKKINEKFTKEANALYEDLSYKIKKADIARNIILLVMTILYFGVIQYFMKGQTIFKKFFKLKVSNQDGTEVGLIKMMFRTLLANEVIFMIINILGLIFIPKANFITFNYWMYQLQYVFEMAMLITIAFRDDNKGLHDILFKTEIKYLGEDIEKDSNKDNKTVSKKSSK